MLQNQNTGKVTVQYNNSEAILFTVIVTGLSVKKKDIYICY